MSNIAILHISVALNMNSYEINSFEEIHGDWTELRSEFCFFRQTSTKYFETNP